MIWRWEGVARHIEELRSEPEELGGEEVFCEV